MDWIFCNVCRAQPSVSLGFLLTSCGHLMCKRCKEKDSLTACMVCNQQFTTVPIDRDLHPRLQKLFMNERQIREGNLKKIGKILYFQNEQYARLLRAKHQQMKTVGRAYRFMKKEREKVEHVARRLNSLKERISSSRARNRTYKQKLLEIRNARTPRSKSRTEIGATGRFLAKSPSGAQQYRMLKRDHTLNTTTGSVDKSNTFMASFDSTMNTSQRFGGGEMDLSERFKLAMKSPKVCPTPNLVLTSPTESEITTPKILHLPRNRASYGSATSSGNPYMDLYNQYRLNQQKKKKSPICQQPSPSSRSPASITGPFMMFGVKSPAVGLTAKRTLAPPGAYTN